MKRVIQLFGILCISILLYACQTVSITEPVSAKIILNQQRNNVMLPGQTGPVRKVYITYKNGDLIINAPNKNNIKNISVTIYLMNRKTAPTKGQKHLAIVSSQKQTLHTTIYLANLKTISAKGLKHLTIVSSQKPSLQTINISRVSYTNISGKLNINTLSAKNIVQLKTKGALNIQTIQTKGDGKAYINGLASRNLTINNSGSFKLYVNDYMVGAIINLNQSNNAFLKLTGIFGKKFSVNATDDAMIQITGEAKLLDAHLARYSILNAKFLKTKVIKIVTTDNASATIYPINKLFAKISNSSEVKYLGKPKHIYKTVKNLGLLSRI